tara:strand:+ start:1615 stop:2580 length:966 start_codon:yes stop_codon:yes gene_type:complete
MNNSISAVITTYLRPQALARAMQSIAAQQLQPQELIVVDNANDADTAEVVANAADNTPFPVRYIAEHKRGASAARNRGLTEAQGAFVAFLDDDVWLPNHLLSFSELCANKEGMALFGGYLARYGTPGKLILPDNDRLFSAYVEDSQLKLLTRPKAPLDRPFFTPSMTSSVIRTALARQVMFDEELAGREDIYFVWLLAERGDILIHQEVHALADQLDTSLFSVAAGASEVISLRMALKKAHYGVMMLERVVKRCAPSPHLMHELSSAYFDASYFNAKAGNTRLALKYLMGSLRIRPEHRHMKLAFRVVESVLKNRVFPSDE